MSATCSLDTSACALKTSPGLLSQLWETEAGDSQAQGSPGLWGSGQVSETLFQENVERADVAQQ